MSLIYDREKGIAAIIDIHRAGGVVESPDGAAAAWDSFSIDDQIQTTMVHQTLFALPKPTQSTN